MLVCGASFAGLAVARELAGARTGGAGGSGAGAGPLRHRREADLRLRCPDRMAGGARAEPSVRQTFSELVIHTPRARRATALPFSFSTFDYPQLCSLLDDQNDAEFETATVQGRRASSNGSGSITIATDRGDVSAPLVVDALGWRRVLDVDGYQPPDAPLSRGLEVHPHGNGRDLEIWIERSIVPAGYGWSFPADDEMRVGVGSFDPRFHVKEPTVDLAERLQRDAVRYQGNWIPHKLRDGHRRWHLLRRRLRRPLPAADRRGHPHRVLLRHRLRQGAPPRSRRQGFPRYRAAPLRRVLRAARVEVPLDAAGQRVVPRVPPPAPGRRHRARWATSASCDWSFDHYLTSPTRALRMRSRPGAPGRGRAG